jgi:hypothetical protein
MKKKRGKEKKEKKKEEEELGRRQPLLQGLEGSVLRNVLRVNSVRCPKLVQNPMDNIWHIRRFSSARRILSMKKSLYIYIHEIHGPWIHGDIIPKVCKNYIHQGIP